MVPELNFYTNAPISLFIALHLKEPKVLDSSWKDTQLVMSLNRISKGKDSPKFVKAKESIPFLIYTKNFPTGKINIPLVYTPEIPMANLILWYGVNASGAKSLSCGGEA